MDDSPVTGYYSACPVSSGVLVLQKGPPGKCRFISVSAEYLCLLAQFGEVYVKLKILSL